VVVARIWAYFLFSIFYVPENIPGPKKHTLAMSPKSTVSFICIGTVMEEAHWCELWTACGFIVYKGRNCFQHKDYVTRSKQSS